MDVQRWRSSEGGGGGISGKHASQHARGRFLARSGDHWVMQRLRYKVGVAAERLAPAIRVREVEDEVEATGTHIGVVASVFLRIQDVNG